LMLESNQDEKRTAEECDLAGIACQTGHSARKRISNRQAVWSYANGQDVANESAQGNHQNEHRPVHSFDRSRGPARSHPLEERDSGADVQRRRSIQGFRKEDHERGLHTTARQFGVIAYLETMHFRCARNREWTSRNHSNSHLPEVTSVRGQ